MTTYIFAVSSDSDSDASQPTSKPSHITNTDSDSNTSSIAATSSTKGLSDEQVKAAFSQHYMQRVTTEFAEDLDKIRVADDFKGAESVEVLIRALRQGVDGWSMENMRRVVGDTK
jgi:ribosome assembly protein 3